MELLLSSVKDHYGYLPNLYCCIVALLLKQKASVLKNENYGELLMQMYRDSRNMIVNKTCADQVKTREFVQNAFILLHQNQETNFKFFDGTIQQEIFILRKIMETDDSVYSDYSRAELCFIEKNYQRALSYVDRYQEKLTSFSGNMIEICMTNCYSLKAECYIQLGHKILAKKVLKKLKRFKANSNKIEELRLKIREMPDDVTPAATEKKKVRTRMKCSSYVCENVEAKVGDYKHCSACRLKYYCSRKCQKQHWRDGHQKECKKS